jgi:hypothetical protein
VGEALEIVIGHDGTGWSLKVKTHERIGEVERVAGNVHRGRLRSWARVVVMTVAPGGSRRAFVLEPGPDENELRHGAFSVRGRFVIVEKANAAKAADRLWDETVVA